MAYGCLRFTAVHTAQRVTTTVVFFFANGFAARRLFQTYSNHVILGVLKFGGELFFPHRMLSNFWTEQVSSPAFSLARQVHVCKCKCDSMVSARACAHATERYHPPTSPHRKRASIATFARGTRPFGWLMKHALYIPLNSFIFLQSFGSCSLFVLYLRLPPFYTPPTICSLTSEVSLHRHPPCVQLTVNCD